MTKSLIQIQEEIRQFRDDRGWEKFHDPVSLAAAINVEAGELLELFLWKDGDESLKFAQEHEGQVRDELADILIFTVNLANCLDIDLEEAIGEKIKLNAQRFPTSGHSDSPPSRKNVPDE